MSARSLKQHGRIDILVNNAGIPDRRRSLLKMTPTRTGTSVLAVNLSRRLLHVAGGAVAHGRAGQRQDREHLLCSAAQIGNIGQANYAASKSGLFGLTRTLAREAAALLDRAGHLDDPHALGLTVNAVAPGLCETEMIAGVPDQVMEKLREQIPLKRLARADEVARVIHFLCADESAHITGQVLSINGGMEM